MDGMKQRIASPFEPSIDNLKFEEPYCVCTVDMARGISYILWRIYS